MLCECGGQSSIKDGVAYLYVESGLDNIWLSNVQARVCDSCDRVTALIPGMDRLHDAIARAIVLKPARLSGGEMRFLRKHLALGAARWAALLHVAPETLSRWEHSDLPIGPQSDLLARLLHLRIREENAGEFVDDPAAATIGTLDLDVAGEVIYHIDARSPASVTYEMSS